MQVSELAPCEGYWLNLLEGGHYPVEGPVVELCERDLGMGWSLIGVPLEGGAVSGIGQDPAGTLISTFGFNGGYSQESDLRAGSGYWVNLSQGGRLNLFDKGIAKVVLPSVREKTPSGIIWTRAQALRQELHLGVDVESVVALPPVPPSGALDIRVKIGPVESRQVPLTSAPMEYEVHLQGTEGKLGWEMFPDQPGQWELRVNGNVYPLQGRGEVVVDPVNDPVYLRMVSPLPLPQNHALQQNFPNPFNPGTTIQYSLPEAGPVSLKIYDMAGQVVRQLVNQIQNAGNHQTVWDGLDASGTPTANGVYIYELRAGEYRALRKMLLIK